MLFLIGKCLKFNRDFKNAKNNLEKLFDFEIIACVKLSLVGREILISAVNVLTNSLRSLHITKREFFQHNYLHSD